MRRVPRQGGARRRPVGQGSVGQALRPDATALQERPRRSGPRPRAPDRARRHARCPRITRCWTTTSCGTSPTGSRRAAAPPETTDDERAGWHVVRMHQRRPATPRHLRLRAGVRQRVVRQQPLAGPDALGDAVHEPSAELHDPRCTIPGARDPWNALVIPAVTDAVARTQPGHDRQPHRDVGGGDEHLTAHDPSGPLEGGLERDVQVHWPSSIACSAKAVRPRERDLLEDVPQLGLRRGIALALSGPSRPEPASPVSGDRWRAAARRSRTPSSRGPRSSAAGRRPARVRHVDDHHDRRARLGREVGRHRAERPQHLRMQARRARHGATARAAGAAPSTGGSPGSARPADAGRPAGTAAHRAPGGRSRRRGRRPPGSSTRPGSTPAPPCDADSGRTNSSNDCRGRRRSRSRIADAGTLRRLAS